jgi:purine-binding chemotaxis protein CheW
MANLHTNLIDKTDTGGEFQLVVFNIGTEEFGIDIKKVREIIRMVNITEIPGAPPYVKGVINLRGRIIVVINMNVIMGIKSREYDARTRIVLLELDNMEMGFIVESVTEVLRICCKDIEPAPPLITGRIRSEYLEGVGKLEDRLLKNFRISTVSPQKLRKPLQKKRTSGPGFEPGSGARQALMIGRYTIRTLQESL